MSITKKHRINSRSEYTVTYSNMRGVDFSSDGEGAKRYRFSHLENMYRDYDGDGAGIIESIPGFRRLFSTKSRINGIYSHKDASGGVFIIVHAGPSLFRLALSALEKDSAASPSIIATVPDKKSAGFINGSNLYILFGGTIAVINGDGECRFVGDVEDEERPYVPTTYVNGVEYEQRNLLTNNFIERYKISFSDRMSAANEHLKYKIISEEDGTCAVVGIDSGHSSLIRIPSYATIGEKQYKVYEISDMAFKDDEVMKYIHIAEGVERIGKMAFCDCTSIETVMTPNSIKIIDNGAFSNCFNLTKLHLGSGIKKVGISALSFCTELESIDYAADPASFALIENNDILSTKTINYNVKYSNITINVPIYSKAKRITGVAINGAGAVSSSQTKNGLVYAVQLTASSTEAFDGKEVLIRGELDPSSFTKNTVGTNFLEEEGASIDSIKAIMGCTVCTCFDGRVFISGNPTLPNTVFYSSRDKTGRNNPLYFGILNYFNDGAGAFPVISMLAAGDSLAVFKAGNDGGGSIFYHTPKETGIDILPKIYPVSYIHSGISAVGESISFFDDPVFISSLGLSALEKQAINLERSVVTRSYNVNARLLCEDLSSVRLAKWCGYLVMAVNGHMYLADSRETFVHRSGAMQYEWYYLTGIGTYSGEKKVYRYSSVGIDGYEIHPREGEVCNKGIYGDYTENGYIYYTVEDGIKYHADLTEEYTGGSFSPVCSVYGIDDKLLIFGTESGDICVFNNDMRSKAPERLASQPDFDQNEYNEKMGRRIHPDFYSFAGHAPRYVLKTVNDNCSIPNLTKNTVKHSLVIKLRSFGNSSLVLEAGTDRSGYSEICRVPDSSLNFEDVDFASLSFKNTDYITLPTMEKEKRWVEKQLTIYSSDFRSPIGICSITYRFTVKGKIKKR